MSVVQRRNSASGKLSKSKRTRLYDSAVVLAGHEGPVYTAKFSPNGLAIASGGHDKQILLWRLPTDSNEENANYGMISGHKSAVTSLQWVLGTCLFSTSADSNISFWDAESGQRTRRGVGHELVVNDCAATSNGTCVSVGDDGTIRVWDEREKHEVKTIRTKYPLLCCDVTSDGSTVFTSGIDPAIQAYDLRSEKQLWTCSGMVDSVSGLDLSSDGAMLVARSMDGQIRTLSAKSSTPPGMSRMGQHNYAGAMGGLLQMLTRATFTSDDVYIVLGSDDSSTIIWGTATRRMVNKFPGHEGVVIDVDTHPSEKILLSSSNDGTVIVREF